MRWTDFIEEAIGRSLQELSGLLGPDSVGIAHSQGQQESELIKWHGAEHICIKFSCSMKMYGK